MHSQLQEIVQDFERAEKRLQALERNLSEERWTQRKDPARWCISECIGHLNLTSNAYIPLLRDGIEKARTLGGEAPGKYRRDMIGWLLYQMIKPPARFRVKTAARFVLSAIPPRKELIGEFNRLQTEQIALVRIASNLPINRISIVSPFDNKMKYNLYSCFTILTAHQHRHLEQAERA